LAAYLFPLVKKEGTHPLLKNGKYRKEICTMLIVIVFRDGEENV
jgi:hypothetical protein